MKTIRLLLFIVIATITSNVASQSVYTTKTGKKYHKESCHYLKSSKRELTLARAVELGYDACSICKPNTSNTNNSSSTNSNSFTKDNQSKTSTTKSTTTQCTGKTKAGNRCKHMTTNSNGRCYQHQS
jgi:hypothetical protein